MGINNFYISYLNGKPNKVYWMTKEEAQGFDLITLNNNEAKNYQINGIEFSGIAKKALTNLD